jgi:hypothetical protein
MQFRYRPHLASGNMDIDTKNRPLRASDFESEGREFESLRARQLNQTLSWKSGMGIWPISYAG